MTIIRPGQRMAHVPGLGVRTSSRAVASAGSGTDWSVWFTNFWDAKSAASQAASYLDLVGSNNLSVGSAPAWASGTGWTFTNDWLDTGIAPASTGTLMIQYASASGTSRVLGGCFKLATNERFFIGVSSGGDNLWGYGDGSWTGASFAASGNMAIAANTGYVNGSSVSTVGGSWAATALTMYLGARNNNGTADLKFNPVTIIAAGYNPATLTGPQMTAAYAAMAAL